ncbi:cysteine desulfurase family protein [Gemmiger sp.]|uniref:cysteine desulfurase family protein n=1 Tax=Gemmiger sp. TaxID=2049027 RepID=UPI002F91FD9D
MIYLDYTANTPADPVVLDAFIAAEQRYIANPNSTHIAGQQARAEMDRVTSSIAQHLGVQPAEIIYTSGASEANNLAVKGIAQAARHIGKHIISTELEHSSVGASLSVLQQQEYEIDLLRIGRDGRVDLDQLRELLRDDTILVAVCAVDSELGTVQPIREIAELVKLYPGCRLHVDATQAVGKTDLWLDGVDTMSFTAHKFYGLNGIGALYKRRGLVITPQISGGASTTIYRSGTPTLGLAVSLDAALTRALDAQAARTAQVRLLHDRLVAALRRYSLVRINSPETAVPHIINVSVTGIKGTRFQQALSEQGVCVSVKSACSSDGMPSKAVFAVSRDRRNALSSWRISISHLTTEEEIEGFLQAFDTCYKTLTNKEN